MNIYSCKKFILLFSKNELLFDSLSHGYQTGTKKVSAISEYFETVPYRLDEKTGRIDYDALEFVASLYRPKIIIAGASAYPRKFDYERMKKITDKIDAYLMAYIAHISGMTFKTFLYE